MKRLTLFTGTLVQDSALSVSGLDRVVTADKSFTMVDGRPVMAGRGVKGAAVAMAKRFFDPLPRAISDDISNGTLRRSAWEFEDLRSEGAPDTRAGVGIDQKTGARAEGVLFDLEVLPSGTKWNIAIRVDWSQVQSNEEGSEVAGILGYVLSEHWSQGRCWLGGGVARGLGWCTLTNLKAYEFDDESYEKWVRSDRKELPQESAKIPVVTPTRSWRFRTLDAVIEYGEYSPDGADAPWGLDMLAVGAHSSASQVQKRGTGKWAVPSWAAEDTFPKDLETDRAILMEGDLPLLPGSSVRGPLRHSLSRALRRRGEEVTDPHTKAGDLGDEDPAGKVFGTTSVSSRLLIRDARAEGEWYAARLHMHAEDEFTAGSYGSAKRETMRVLKGKFPVRIVVEGKSPAEVDPLVEAIETQIALGRLGHLAIGGHKTHGAGSGHWHTSGWQAVDVKKERDWSEPTATVQSVNGGGRQAPGKSEADFPPSPPERDCYVKVSAGPLDAQHLTLGDAARLAKEALGEHELTAWWCEPTIDLAAATAPQVYGEDWQSTSADLKVDEVMFGSARAVWHAARTSSGTRYVLTTECNGTVPDAISATVTDIPARLHASDRFASLRTHRGALIVRRWSADGRDIAFTLAMGER